jgi:hypothetical protein
MVQAGTRKGRNWTDFMRRSREFGSRRISSARQLACRTISRSYAERRIVKALGPVADVNVWLFSRLTLTHGSTHDRFVPIAPQHA